VDSYQSRPPGPARGSGAANVTEIVNDASAVLRLIPFPGVEALSPVALLPLRAPSVSELSTPVATPIPDIVGQQATSIVSQAASILDEEMAQGVLAARRSNDTFSRGSADPGSALLRQVHDVVDRIAEMWPGMLNGAVPPLTSSRTLEDDAYVPIELRTQEPVKPGQRATITMTLRNSENRTVSVVPAATDLLGSRVGRIAGSNLEFTPKQYNLAPKEQRDVTITIVVPGESEPGCYSGLVVVTGVDYLRALVTIDVT
jgi:hypothetical protein